MNKQDIFDTAVRYLGKQGRPSANTATGSCYYRAPNGDKCAAGVLIPDEAYHPDMERKTVARLLMTNYLAARLPEFFRTERSLIDDLQRAHDVSWLALALNGPSDGGDYGQNDARFVQELRLVALVYGLNASVITEAFPGH